MIASASPLWPTPNPHPWQADVYLALKKGLHEASEEMSFFP